MENYSERLVFARWHVEMKEITSGNSHIVEVAIPSQLFDRTRKVVTKYVEERLMAAKQHLAPVYYAYASLAYVFEKQDGTLYAHSMYALTSMSIATYAFIYANPTELHKYERKHKLLTGTSIFSSYLAKCANQERKFRERHESLPGVLETLLSDPTDKLLPDDLKVRLQQQLALQEV